MSEDIRYKMQHMGDIFVDALSCVIDSAKKSAKVVVLTYDIGDFKKKKRQYLSRIGMRIVQAKKADLADLNRDATLVALIADAEKIDRYIEFCEEKKKNTALGWQRKAGYADGAL